MIISSENKVKVLSVGRFKRFLGCGFVRRNSFRQPKEMNEGLSLDRQCCGLFFWIRKKNQNCRKPIGRDPVSFLLPRLISKIKLQNGLIFVFKPYHLRIDNLIRSEDSGPNCRLVHAAGQKPFFGSEWAPQFTP